MGWLSHVLVWGLAGSVFFTVLIAAVAWTGLADAVRDPEGRFRRPVSTRGLVAFGVAAGFMVGWPALSNGWLPAEQVGLPGYWAASYGVLAVINLWDLVVLDWLILVVWHPRFLELPDTRYYREVGPHLLGFFRGLVWLVPVSLLAALVSAWVW